MKLQIDLKSALCGLAIGVVAMLTLGADSPAGKGIGRYQVASPSGTYALVIDTVTGKVWNSNQTGATVRGSDGDFYDVKNQ